MLIGGITNASWRPLIRKALFRKYTGYILVAFSVFAVLKWSTLQESFTEFLLKDDSDTSITESLQSSRSGLIERSMENFRAAPLTGIGFGVPSEPGLVRIETGALGLPTGASVEKGFMPSAVLEETGLTGAIMVVFIIVFLIKPVTQKGSLSMLCLLMTCLMINAGEMVFFSVGGMGLHLWLLMAFCYNYALSAPEPAQPTGRQRRFKM
jgi:hypothetical protein